MFNLFYITLNIVIVLIVYIIIRLFYLKGQKKSKIKWVREILLAVFIAYTAAMFILLFLNHMAGLSLFTDKGFFNPIERIRDNIGVNFIPFKSIYEIYMFSVSPTVVIRNILGNIVLFIPISFLMGILWEKWGKMKNMLLFSLLVPCGIEFIQLFIGRAVDVDDVILNFVGLMIGFLVSKLVCKILIGQKPARNI